ncbi:hypothetical protein HELRODRAFT_179678 [Helobdella robusta]|uniref:Copper transport protein n=1 Tax=Helobdella robusta TaxID=6412 RepID=T1FF08_HELRO|nr:hypothetical protein HELRODRAFT_179678 [Helobdella robusta]ESN95093.1 hypothetical protein HELRODRAFT_179678 [Helobdella robusta]
MELYGEVNYDEMLNYFHTRLRNVILFQGWETYNAPDVVLACVFAFVVAIIFEVVQSVKECYAKKCYKWKLIERTERFKDESNDYGGVDRAQTESTKACSSPFTRSNLIKTILYTIHSSLGILIMLIYMTFNTYLCLAIILGKAVGFFFLNDTDFY